MTKKRMLLFGVIAVTICVVVGVVIRADVVRQEEQRIEEERQMEQYQKQREEAERIAQIQRDFDELVALAYEYQDSIERLSVASVEQMKEVMDIDNFDFDRVYAEAGLEEDFVQDKFYLDVSVIWKSMEGEQDLMSCPEVLYKYIGMEDGSVEMYLLYYYSDTPEEIWEYYGAGNGYDGYEQITKNLYAFWFEPRYT